MKNQSQTWQFIDEQGTFRLENPHHTSYLYFPLVNEAGMMSAITPTLNGDIKINQNAFLTLPVSLEDLHDARSARNFWVFVEGIDPWSVTGNSAVQTTQQFLEDPPEEVSLEAGFLWQKVTRDHYELGLRAEVVNFVPASPEQVELMKITITNVADKPIRFTPTAAIPIYGRSADNLRDHRHVTSLLHRIQCDQYGILVRPTLSFDERGHHPNNLTYVILGVGENSTAPVGFFPLVEEFVGEGGRLDWPEAIVRSSPPTFKAGQTQAGFEALGGLRFEEVNLPPGETAAFILILAILEEEAESQSLVDKFGTVATFDSTLRQTRNYWKTILDTFGVVTGDSRFDLWMRWVSLQPSLRRLYGNSFLPAHDYGRGGRGWRDLWQDILALLLTERGDVSELLYGNFAGVRIDGSNATIIGSSPGEFKADRNNIPRIWMDHGAWPLLTTRLYLDQTGDLAFLLREQTYFKDHLIFRSRNVDPDWEPEQGTFLQTAAHEPYYGTILEHLLIQHLTPFFNVGAHNHILLEDADWNDGMDMAPENGESVAFTGLYASNLRQLSEWVLALGNLGVDRVALAAEIMPLLDTLTSPVSYASVERKRSRLAAYYKSCRHTVSGEKVAIPLENLAKDLAAKSEWLINHIRTNEWLKTKDGYRWFNGYYDNDSQGVEGEKINGIRMTLTGQVFTLMGGIATLDQALEIVRAADQYLLDSSVGGYRLNTDFGETMLNLGRAFGFAYGHKENGAMFSHMAVMYAKALYQRGLVHQGYKVLEGIYQHCQDFATCRIYPGIPEYINPNGRGMYPWLTGSASWYLLTLVTEVFGVGGISGDLMLNPKLVRAQFDESGKAALITLFADKLIEVTYQNPGRLDYGHYQVISISIDGELAAYSIVGGIPIIARKTIRDRHGKTVNIKVLLGNKAERKSNANP
jgi:cellobiose phosphorylase